MFCCFFCLESAQNVAKIHNDFEKLCDFFIKIQRQVCMMLKCLIDQKVGLAKLILCTVYFSARN